VEEIITALSRVHWFRVIARNSSFTYKGSSVDIRQVGQELGVRYVLEGSILSARLRLGSMAPTTLPVMRSCRSKMSASSLSNLPAQTCRPFAASMSGPVIRTRFPAFLEGPSAKRTEDLDAYDLYLRAMANHFALTKPASDEVLRPFDRALELDRNYSAATECV
jgi:adenylate cyclase